MRVLLGALFTMWTVACDSPLNHQVREIRVGEEPVLTALSFNKSQYTAKAQWLLGPFGDVTKPSQLLVTIYNAEGRPAKLSEGLELSFYATMPSMGHGLDNPGFFTEVAEGVYLNSTITFNMGGDWKMELWLQDQNYEIVEAVEWFEFL